MFFAVDFDLCTCLVRGLWKDGGNWPAENETRCELDIQDESAMISKMEATADLFSWYERNVKKK